MLIKRTVHNEVEILSQSIISYANAKNPKGSYTESTPVYLKAGECTKAIIPTGFTYLADVMKNKNVLIDPDAYSESAVKITNPDTLLENGGLRTPDSMEENNFWKRNYYGILHACVLKNSECEDCLIGIMHGENKNETLNGIYYNNTVKPFDTKYRTDEYAGYDPITGKYHDNYDNYFSFIGITRCPLSENNGCDVMRHDEGPVIWPDNSYLDGNDIKTSGGLRHPSAIIYDRYLYIFYLDESVSNKGYRVARSPVEDMGKAGSFKKYYNGLFSNNGLPENFDRNDRNIMYINGEKSTLVINTNTIRFSVAKITGTNRFLGVDERIGSNGEVSLFLRLSDDLVNWSNGTEIPETKRNSWYEGILHYPLFYNLALNDSMEIDPDGFYILGTDHSGNEPRVQYLKLSIKE